ncbi:hypothetical protein JCM3766R1_004882 [Sporobolomyces carnicolor]
MRIDTSKHAVFPVEVMNQIFRSSVLDSITLARCCLLSRRYLPSARKWLYRDVEVKLRRFYVDGSRGEQSVFEYSRPTAKLIAAILEKPALGRLIRRTEFSVTYRSFSQSGFRTRGGEAVATMLELAPTMSALALGYGETYSATDNWLDEALPQIQFDRSHSLRELSLTNMTETASEFVSNLPNLRHLAVRYIQAQTVQYQLKTTNLETFSMEYVLADFDLQYFISHSAPTIRNLCIPFSKLVEVELEVYPRLGRVELVLPLGHCSDEDPLNGKMFYRFFEECANLVTIAFNGCTLQSDVGDVVFGRSGGLGDSEWPSPQLRRVEFVDDVSIDQLLLFLRTDGLVSELAVTSNVTPKKMKLVRTLCEDSGVELILL